MDNTTLALLLSDPQVLICQRADRNATNARRPAVAPQSSRSPGARGELRSLAFQRDLASVRLRPELRTRRILKH